MNQQFSYRTLFYKIKKHIALPSLLLAITIIALIGAQFFSVKNNQDITIKHLKGDSSVLKAVHISGEIIDGYSKTSFQTENDLVYSNTLINRQNAAYLFNRFTEGSIKTLKNDNFRIYEETYNQRKLQISHHFVDGSKLIKSYRTHVEVPIHTNLNKLINPIEYGLAVSGEDVYFTLVTSQWYSGSNGIYKLDFKPDAVYSPEEELSTELVSFELKSPYDSYEKGVNVLGLEAVNDKLILILEQNNELHLRVFDTTGTLLGEDRMTNFKLSSANSSSNISDTNVYNEKYESFANQNPEQLILAFTHSNGGFNKTFITLDLKDDIKIVDQTTFTTMTDTFEEDYNIFIGKRYAAFINGRLYYVAAIKEIIAPEAKHMDFKQIMHLRIYAFEHNKQVYEGEIVTHINDDNIMWKNHDVTGNSYSNVEREYRSFYSLNISEVK